MRLLCAGTRRKTRSLVTAKCTRSHSTSKNVEVELKFQFTPADELKVLNNAKLVKEVKFTDKYYDNVTSYILTTNDIWLRQRDLRWECKIPTFTANDTKPPGKDDQDLVDPQYLEIENEPGIVDFLVKKSFAKVSLFTFRLHFCPSSQKN
jgi:hypothetical protein